MMNCIRQIREAQGLSQAALAELVNTSQPEISRLEKEERRLTVDWLRLLSAALNCSVCEIIEGSAQHSRHYNQDLLGKIIEGVINLMPVFKLLTSEARGHILAIYDVKSQEPEAEQMKQLPAFINNVIRVDFARRGESPEGRSSSDRTRRNP